MNVVNINLYSRAAKPSLSLRQHSLNKAKIHKTAKIKAQLFIHKIQHPGRWNALSNINLVVLIFKVNFCQRSSSPVELEQGWQYVALCCKATIHSTYHVSHRLTIITNTLIQKTGIFSWYCVTATGANKGPEHLISVFLWGEWASKHSTSSFGHFRFDLVDQSDQINMNKKNLEPKYKG